MSNHGLRTTGRPTGNFGRNKIQAKKERLDLTKEILSKENLRIPNRNESFTRLVEAYNKSTDPKIRETLWEMLRQRRATLQPVEVKTTVISDKTHWDIIKMTR